MARKRKSRAAETLQETEPESIQHNEQESEPTVTEEIEQVDEEEEAVVGEEVENDVVEEILGEMLEGEGFVEEELKDDSLMDNNEQETEISDKPSQNDVSANGGTAEGQNDANEDEDELEEEPLEKILEPFSKDQLALLIKEAVTKHPEILESVHKFADADPSSRKIFVHGLGWDANSEMITSVFMNFGEIEDCKVVVDKNSGKAKGYGFLLFKHRNGARRALKEPQKMIGGRMTSCQLASAGPVPAPPPTVGAVASGPHVSEYTQRKIYVSNVSAELDVNKLLEFFSKFGEIEEGPLGLDKQTGKPRGFCLFVYKSAESAKNALQEPHKKFEGHILHCQKAVDGPKHTKGYFNPQQGYPQNMQLQNQPQHHNLGQQGYYQQAAKRGKYAGSSGVMLHTGGHLMAPSAGSSMPAMGFNQAAAVPPAAIGQAVAALLATQGAGLGIGNLLGGIGAGVNPHGGQQMVNNVAGYGGHGGASGYGGQSVMQYGGQSQTSQGGVRPHQVRPGGAPYMGHGL